jgi:hypothetical protein
MPKIIQTTVYQFAELSPQAQEKALEKFWDINVSYDWWEFIYEDAKTIGCRISGFDLDRGNRIDFKAQDSCLDIAKAIKVNHGASCDTFILAMQYLIDYDQISSKMLENDPDWEPNYEPEIEDLSKEFIRALGEDYFSMLKKEYEFLTSEESIKETIVANDYYFTSAGELA